MSAVAVTTLRACVRCGKRQPADRLIYSRFTRNRYCADFAACDRRVKRKARS